MKLVFASNNKNKIKEIKSLLPEGIEILSLEDIGCVIDIPETADTIEGNALMKANFIKRHYGYDCFADDTGLEVNSLNGAPGVYSARYAGESRDDKANMEKLLLNLTESQDRSAHFKTVIALHYKGEQKLFTGLVEGTILKKAIGNEGFGYDPIFQADGMNKSFAEISLSDKNKVSHRAKALKQLIEFLKIQ
ncbi:non-canonical purine NTP diphosphatase [Myroides guanonis]|uniref:dITP/XTP pyrophosphatase n=1 Tax=Myroides guanonis TaxID=1150112 RepID=A0A1I3LFY2_9FLAO|nr:non-canonical purine NTP diphosphatase [Myroides guanonis]SFI83376.1 XTP/dITP diphosphohydrolase [Myroides guanonis]